MRLRSWFPLLFYLYSTTSEIPVHPYTYHIFLSLIITLARQNAVRLAFPTRCFSLIHGFAASISKSSFHQSSWTSSLDWQGHCLLWRWNQPRLFDIVLRYTIAKPSIDGCGNLGITTKLRTSEIASGMYHNLAMVRVKIGKLYIFPSKYFSASPCNPFSHLII